MINSWYQNDIIKKPKGNNIQRPLLNDSAWQGWLPGFAVSEISTRNLGHWSNKNQETKGDFMTFLFVCLFDEKMKNLILEGSGGVAQSMELQCYHFYSDLAQVHQGN